MSYKYILGIDPSGNFKEGKGTTGINLLDAESKQVLLATDIKAMDFNSAVAYWHAHAKFINNIKKNYESLVVVAEEYQIYESKASAQINSKVETARVLGIIEHFCYIKKLPYHAQLASLVKTRWANDILLHKKVIAKHNNRYVVPATKNIINKHILDSIRHSVHFAYFKNPKL